MQSGIYDKFIEAFKQRASSNVVGDPFGEKTFQGPQASQMQFNRIMGYIKSGKGQRATVEAGGKRHGSKSYLIQPTILSNVHANMEIMKEEIFGPVCAIQKCDTEEEVIRLRNESIKGAMRTANTIKAGTVCINNYNNLST